MAASASSLPALEVKAAVRNPAGVFVSEGSSGLQGFDIELLDRFAAWHKNRYGEAVTLSTSQVATIDQLLEQAAANQCTLGVGSITITAERAKKVDFSKPYLPIRMVLFARTGRIAAGELSSTLTGKSLGALAGSTGVTRIAQLQKEVAGLGAKSYADYDALFGALLAPNPEIDGVVTDVTHYWVLSQKEQLEIVAPMSEEQGLGIVLPKGSVWRPKVDAFLDEFRSTPGYFQLVRRYFGKEAADMLMFSKQGG
jgi:polar amino acid transport system substrate-binding protein